jgi:site-specific recombinase XerD
MKIKSINELISARLQWFARAYCQSTQQTQQEALKKFKCWSDERNLSQLADINLSTLESYQRWLYHQTHGRQSKKLSVVYQHKLLQVVKSCFYWASEQQIIHHKSSDGFETTAFTTMFGQKCINPSRD